MCSCLNVSEAEVETAISAGARTVAEVGERCEAGTGCQSCHAGIRILLEAQARRDLAAGRAPSTLHQLSLFELAAGRTPSPAGSHRPRPKKPGGR